MEDTLKDQNHGSTPTAYFAALLALLSQSISTSKGIINKELGTSVVYLLDLVAPYVPHPLLRSKFSQILTNLAPALTHHEAEAPLLRSSIGCLESLLVAQDSAAWALPPTQIGPRRAMAGLLTLAVDHRPKVRKRAQEALTKVLKAPPPSPALDHPAADMCAETALRSLSDIANVAGKSKKNRGHGKDDQHQPGLIHALQLVKTIASASGGWPSRKIEALCELLLNIAKSSNEYLTMAAFETFEIIFAGMADQVSSSKLPRLMEVISELRPSQNDAQLLPPWIAVLSRGYDVSAQIDPQETFQKLPGIFDMISGFLSSTSHNIRISASECMISLMANCIPHNVLLEPSVFDERIFEKLGKSATELLSVKYQAAWMEVFNVLGAMFKALRWRSTPVLSEVVKAVGELRGNDAFNGKKEADLVLGKAVHAMGPDTVLAILPLNLAKPKVGQPGRAWLLPVLRDHVSNTTLAHFRSEFVPLSENMFQKVLEHGTAEKTMEVKIFETLVQQIWALLPGYCDLPLDTVEAFDQSFAELISNLLYKQIELRADICRALQMLVDSNKSILTIQTDQEDLMLQRRVSKIQAQKNIEHLAGFASNLLAVLFNVYSQTLPNHRAYILRCINAYLSIIAEKELMDTFARVTTMLESSIRETGSQTQADKQKQPKSEDKMPPMSHTLMDLVITISIYLPRDCFATLFRMASLILVKDDDPQLQKKAYKLVPRLAESETGRQALVERNDELQQLILSSADKTSAPARRDRLDTLSQIVSSLPKTSLHFIPSILSEVVISAKEVNDKARTSAFNLLVLMGEKMAEGGNIVNSKVPHMPDDAPDVQASLEEYFTMVSAGLAGSTPHMVSASITALTRILYEFRDRLPINVVEDLVQTMDLFLTSNNREIVRSVLGFVKVSVISLPSGVIVPKLETLVPNLMVWSHEHKAHFRAKVKHILERMMRRFGADIVETYCPEADKKLVQNIRKTRERRKRKKDAAAEEGGTQETSNSKRKSRFESEFDEAVYGSDESDEGSDISDDEALGRRKKGQTFIVEDEDEPLDLLDRKAFANISSTKPVKSKQPPTTKTKAKVNLDGKLILGGNDDDADDDAMMLEFGADGDFATNGKEPGDGTLEGGINAYVDAIKGRDAVQRGQKGKLKFSNKRSKDAQGEDEMEIDEEAVAKKVKAKGQGQTKKGQANGGGQRKGLGIGKTRGGRVVKGGASARRKAS